MLDIEHTLIEFIRNKFLLGQQREKFSSEQPLLNGVIDSIDIMKLVVFIEEKFDIIVQDEDLVPENFQNVKKMTEYIQQKINF
jgi:acyl carrier protein